MIEYDHEPIRGLPGPLPEGEEILWQGSPDRRVFARTALHTRIIGFYFVALVALAVASGSLGGALATVAAGLIGIGLFQLFAWGVEKTTVYTLTNKRVVLRIGVALNKCINVPLGKIGSADLRPLGQGYGEISLDLTDRSGLGYLMLWPHARPWKLGQPQPMLRAVPEAEKVAAMLARASAKLVEIERSTAPVSEEQSRTSRPMREAAA